MRALWVLALTACTQPHTDRLPEPGEGRNHLVVHEWGTYTSLQGSDGRSMDGLHHAEHLLPPFVLSRAASAGGHKGIAVLPEPVNQKLETPVIYFYGDQGRATVKVDFPEGLISEWYPAAAQVSPPLEEELAGMANGSMSWTVDLMDERNPAFAPPAVEEASIWAPSRKVESLGVRSGGQDEHFIFYRGLGRFDRPVRVLSTTRTLMIANDSYDRIPAAFLLIVGDGEGSITDVGALDGRQQISVTPEPMTNIRPYVPDAKLKVERALIASGLYADEARAMVETWHESYFTSPGTRVLYVVPREWTDALLPIQIDPQPTELVRTLIGRIEVMTAAEEQAIVSHVEAAFRGEASLVSDTYGRFTEPKLRRALQLTGDRAAASWCQGLVDTFAALP